MTPPRHVCTFHLDPFVFGIDVAAVQEVSVDPVITRVPLTPAAVRGVINLRGQIVTALDLRRRLGMPSAPEAVSPVSIVVRIGDEPVSLLADRAGEVLGVRPEDFEGPPDTLRGPARELILGAFKLPDRLLLLLDPVRVAQPEEEARRAPTPE